RISGWNWAHESEYYIGFDSAAFDTAGIRSFGIYDTMFWRFRIAPEVLTVDRLYETFDDACEQGVLPVGWSVINKKGNQQWGCHTAYGTTSYRITSYSGGKYHENEDWLISPKIHLPGDPDHIFFKQYKRRAGEELQLLWSEEYPGYGDPAAFNWNELRVESGAAD